MYYLLLDKPVHCEKSDDYFGPEKESKWLVFAGYRQFAATVFRGTSDVGDTEAVILLIRFAGDDLAVFYLRMVNTGIGD